ncbi:iron transporter [Kocuria sp. cx-455]|jgi:hypothetical protein|uniref:iron transporter n=1 Tax=Bacteria TaxID=2 RepID=UPI0004AB4463|nr:MULTISPECIES: iron transporter [Bacteria]MBD2764783.1 iron transporter [Kocuria sp. cx-455]
MHVWGSPETRTFGRLRVDVAVGPIARMFDAEDWQQPANAGGGAVFAGRADEVVENIAAEPGPADPPADLFNLDAHIYDVDTGHPVPYLDVAVDVIRLDGDDDDRPEFTGLGLVPVARPRKGTAGLHYGNNVALDPEGSYRVWVHIGASALTGTDEPSSLDFTLDLGAADE